MPLYEPPERYTPLEESDGERVTATGYVSAFADPPDEPPPARPFRFGFGADAQPRNARTRSRHYGAVPRRA